MTDQVTVPDAATDDKPTVPLTGSVQPTLTIGDPAPASVPPVVAPAKVDPPAEDAVIEYTKTGDVGLDMALAFVGKQGIDGQHPAMVAAQAGDFSLLKAELASKGAKGWEQYVALGEKSYAEQTAKATTQQAADRAAIYSAAGGEEEWKAVQSWAAANATDAEKADLNKQLNSGGFAAKAAATYLRTMYDKANNVVVDGAPVVTGGSKAAPSNSGALSPSEYSAAVRKLHTELGPRMEDSKAYADLARRRSLYRD